MMLKQVSVCSAAGDEETIPTFCHVLFYFTGLTVSLSRIMTLI